jgi:hypothetical protein
MSKIVIDSHSSLSGIRLLQTLPRGTKLELLSYCVQEAVFHLWHNYCSGVARFFCHLARVITMAASNINYEFYVHVTVHRDVHVTVHRDM